MVFFKRYFLVRPDDFQIFELDNSNSCYRPYANKEIKNRPFAYDHFTFDNLTEHYGFFPINENEIEFYEKKNELYHKWQAWSSRPDGHGSVKGGTMEEYLKLINNG